MPFTQHHKNHLISQLEKAIKAVQEMPVTHNGCLDCIHVDTMMLLCKKANMTKIPAHIVPIGCEKFEFDATAAPL